MRTLIFGLGRGIPESNRKPDSDVTSGAILEGHHWYAFRQGVRRVAEQYGGTVQSDVTGLSWSPGWGREEACWIAVEFPAAPSPADQADPLDVLRRDVKALAHRYGQDAIALTVGTVEFLEGEPTLPEYPAPEDFSDTFPEGEWISIPGPNAF